MEVPYDVVNKKGGRLKGLLTVLAMLVYILGLTTSSYVFAVNEDLSNPSNKTGFVGEPVAITDLEVTGGGNDNIALSITAEAGLFQFSSETAIVTGGDTSSVTVSGPREDVNATLASLSYTASAPGSNTITVDYGSTVTDVIIDPIGGHAYKIIDANLTWNQARAAAKELSYGGVQGYLANITSEDEDAFIVDHLTGNGWIGASDQGVEGDWIWMDGPEADTQFWEGNNIANGGVPVIGEGDVALYNNWNWNEPNNSANEDCAEYIVGLGWNDLNCDGQTRDYVVEFGAASETPEQIIRQFDITVSPATKSIASCEQLFALDSGNRYDTIDLTQDIDCQGIEAEPLFNSGDGFVGAFDGNGFTIRNVTIEDGSDVGLVGRAKGAIFHDLNLDDFVLSGSGKIGGLVGVSNNTQFTNVHLTNVTIVATNGWAGGLVGDLGSNEEGSSLLRVSATGNITTSGNGNVGGIAGFAEGNNGTLTIQQTYADVDIIIADEVTEDFGGLIGELEIDSDDGVAGAGAVIRNSYAWGNLAGTESSLNIGGLIGRIDFVSDPDLESSAVLENVYASGGVSGADNVGGLIGRAESPHENATLTIENSFAMGKVNTLDGALHKGGFLALLDSGSADYTASTNNYWDQARTGQEACDQGEVISDCTAVNVGNTNPGYFINNAVSPPLGEWDFETIWVTNQFVPPTFEPTNGGQDLNGDFTPDEDQPNVGGYVSPITGKIVAIDVGENCELTTDDLIRESQFAVQDQSYDYVHGLWDFEAECDTPGITTTIKLYYYDVSPNGLMVRKYNPNTQIYASLSDAVLTEQTIHGYNVTVATYQVTDGGDRDTDGIEDGTIKDPVGIAQLRLQTNLASTGQSLLGYLLLATTLVALGVSAVIKNRPRQY